MKGQQMVNVGTSEQASTAMLLASTNIFTLGEPWKTSISKMKMNI